MHGLVMLFAHAQRNFRRTRPNQFHVAAEIVSPMRSEIFGGLHQINFTLQLGPFHQTPAKKLHILRNKGNLSDQFLEIMANIFAHNHYSTKNSHGFLCEL